MSFLFYYKNDFNIPIYKTLVYAGSLSLFFWFFEKRLLGFFTLFKPMMLRTRRVCLSLLYYRTNVSTFVLFL